jgi:hypothetical protein
MRQHDWHAAAIQSKRQGHTAGAGHYLDVVWFLGMHVNVSPRDGYFFQPLVPDLRVLDLAHLRSGRTRGKTQSKHIASPARTRIGCGLCRARAPRRRFQLQSLLGAAASSAGAGALAGTTQAGAVTEQQFHLRLRVQQAVRRGGGGVAAANAPRSRHPGPSAHDRAGRAAAARTVRNMSATAGSKGWVSTNVGTPGAPPEVPWP